MNENTAIQAEYRDINTISTEIRMIQASVRKTALEGAIEIGRRLVEAKELLPHGEWGGWLKREFEYSQPTASRLMKLYDEYGSEQKSLFGAESKYSTLNNLSISNALRLIAIPEDEREEFAEKHDLESISTRELDKLIKERDAAEARAEKAEAELEGAQNDLSNTEEDLKAIERQLAELQTAAAEKESKQQSIADELTSTKEQLQKAKDKAKAAADKLKELKENPEVPQEIIDKLTTEAEKKAAEKAAEELQAKTEALSAEREKAVKDATAAAARLDALEKQLALADPDTAVFKTYFEVVQEDFNKLLGCLLKIQSKTPDKAEKLCAATHKLISSIGGQIPGG